MPTPAAIAGLVIGAVLGAGLLCLGVYTVHRYMDWRCRELVDMFQRHTVRVVQIKDPESERKSRGTASDEDKRANAPETEQTLERSWGRPKISGSQDMTGLRGGFRHGGLEDNLNRADVRQMQPYIPRPAHVHAQPTARRQVLGWHQSGTTYDQLWQPTSMFQQADPQGGYYAYIAPHPRVAMAYEQPHLDHPSSYNGFRVQPGQQRAHDGGVQKAAREPMSDPATALQVQKTMESISFEGDSVVVVEEYPFVIEGMMHVRGKKRCKTGDERRKEGRRYSSSTQLGTCSSGQSSASNEDRSRDRIPDGVLRRAQPPLDDYSSVQEYAQRTARSEGGGNLYAQQSLRRYDRQEREAGDSEGPCSIWGPKFGGRQQAGCRSVSKPSMRGGADNEAASKSGYKGEGLKQHRDASVGPRFKDRVNSKSGPVVKASQAPYKKEEFAIPTDPSRSALHNTRLTRTTNGGEPQHAVEQPASDTATVGRSRGIRPQSEVVVVSPVSDISSVRSPVRWSRGTPNTSLLVSDNDRLQGASTPVSPIDNIVMPVWWDRSAGAGTGRSRGSISPEASLRRDDWK